MTVFGLLMSYFVSEYYVVYLFWGLAIFCSVMIDLAWYIAFYPLHHKGTSAVASKAQSQAVDTMGDTLQEKQFDKDEFTEE